ncbi:MAG: exodeoxyribonuclease VII large subunit [Nitrospirae bacterium RIFCSPLOWO2_02_FULL_62_14]|nr:MAG: exodeoxyribonuclease VII large subunit [Nitrospirae bacterium RIFCSPLOWO2_02_FULL_62_14]
MPVSDRPQRILTVSALTALVRERLEEGFTDLWVEGEVSNLRTPSSGHIYFTLKDATSQIRVVLFRAGPQRLRFALKEGLQLVVRGRLTVYEPRGEYQIVLDYLEPKGLGALQLALEQLKEKLARDGLFEQARKRPLPFLPRRVGVVTSLTGAALRDILAVLRRRCPIVGIVVAPVPVQGEDAAAQIAEAVRALSSSRLVDVMIVGRGGGSLEDLWCFNEEVVVRAIAASAVPVVSAVGHEIDYTLADFAADYRAPTPSAAAEAVAPVLDDLFETLRDRAARLKLAVRGRLHKDRQECASALRVLYARPLPVEQAAQRLDDLTGRLGGSVMETLSAWQRRADACRHALEACSPRIRIGSALTLVPQLAKRMEQSLLAVLTLKRQATRSIASALDGLSPLAILGRGYSIVQTVPDGTVLKRAQDVSVGDDVLAKLADGRLLCSVRKILPS